MTRNNFGEARCFVCLLFIYRLQSIMEESQGRNLKTGTEAETMEKGYYLSIACFLIRSKPTYQGVVPHTVGWIFSKQSSIKKMPHRSPFQGDPDFVPNWQKVTSIFLHETTLWEESSSLGERVKTSAHSPRDFCSTWYSKVGLYWLLMGSSLWVCLIYQPLAFQRVLDLPPYRITLRS